jgi:hypothetical protein
MIPDMLGIAGYGCPFGPLVRTQKENDKETRKE